MTNPVAVPIKLVKVEVDGKPVEVDARDNLIEAARKVNVHIPYFCYHPRLSVAGQCRMCLVETSDMPGRLVPGCQVRVKEGLKIITTTPAVKENQRGVMEFHLLNHPVDCPICDQAGECKLQDYYMDYDHQPTRLRTYKLDKPKRVEFGPTVVYDSERCILCSRCVRFMDEIAQNPQLATVNRGDHSRISTFPGQPLDSQYAGNTVDVCPVGALLSRDFRFTSRVWFVNKSPTVCTGCSNGCNTFAESRGNQIYRLLPRRNEEVNQVWMCDAGRASYHATNDGRVEWARIGRAGASVATAATGSDLLPGTDCGAPEAVEEARRLLAPLQGKPGLAVWISAASSIEEAVAALVLGEHLGATRFLLGANADGDSDDFLIRADKNPNRAGVELLARSFGVMLEDGATAQGLNGVRALVALRTEGLAVHKAALERLEAFVALAQNHDEATALAHALLPVSSLYEQSASVINWYGRLQRTWPATQAPRGDAAPGWTWIDRLLAVLGAEQRIGDVGAAFELAASHAHELVDLTFDKIPEDGVVLTELLPAQFPQRAPRPAPRS
jgi:NADH-quinone oxidoreductase subunit G